MPRVGAERLANRRNEIVAAARAVFTAQGYEQTTIGDIARTAGVSDGLPYRYFESKRDLLKAVLDQFFMNLIEHSEAHVARAEGFTARFTTLINVQVRTLIEDTDLFRLFITEVRNLNDYWGSETHTLSRRYTSILTHIIAEGRACGFISAEVDSRLVRDMVFGGIEHMAWRYIVSRKSIDIEAVTASIARLLLNGLLGGKNE